MKRSGMAGLVLAIGLGFGWTYVQGQAEAPKHDEEQQAALMRAKLASTQRVVEGLVSKDFTDIAKGAEELIKICKATEWEAHSDTMYAHHRKELIRQAEKMAHAAARENVEGAAYAYIHALTTCISCHDYCRDVLKIADDRPMRVVPIPTTVDDDAVLRNRPVRR